METMKYKYVSVYKIRGLTHVPEQGDIKLYAKENNGSVIAVLTDKPDEYCHEIDEAQCLGYSLLRAFAVKAGPDRNGPDMKAQIARIRERRKKELAGSDALVFIAEGEVEADFSSRSVERHDYVLGIDIITKETIAEAHSEDFNAILTAIFLSVGNSAIQVTRIAGDVYLIGKGGKPVYSLGLSASGEAYTSVPTTDRFIGMAQAHAATLATKSSLSRVYKLLIQAISRDNDELRRFIFGWSALEILISKLFSEYEKQFVQNLVGAHPANNSLRYFERVREVMQGKYSIIDKFVIVAACIGDDRSEADIENFTKIKKMRDALLHGEVINEKSLPIRETVELLQKYLLRHINPKASRDA
jgi:hypothetical protein